MTAPLPKTPPGEWLDVIEAAVQQWDVSVHPRSKLSEAVYAALYREITGSPAQDAGLCHSSSGGGEAVLLSKAIRACRAPFTAAQGSVGGPMYVTVPLDELNAVLTAAESTLPKPKKAVRIHGHDLEGNVVNIILAEPISQSEVEVPNGQ